VRPGSRIYGNSVAVHQAIRMHQQSGQVARQNSSRLLTPSRGQVAELVREVVEAAPTAEELQRLIDICAQEVEDPGLEFARVETEIRGTTPFAGLVQLLPRDRTELVAYLGLLLVIIQTVIMLTQKPVVVVAPDQVEQIIERVIEHVEQQSPPAAPTTTDPVRKP
jgi:hypothetical protein